MEELGTLEMSGQPKNFRTLKSFPLIEDVQILHFPEHMIKICKGRNGQMVKEKKPYILGKKQKASIWGI